MTHDELLARIKEKGDCPFAFLRYNLEGQKGIEDVFKALMAVVELHKPEWVHITAIPPEYATCKSCYEKYPCPTTQAIEKELG